MLKSIWMHAWDLEGVAPQELIAFLQSCGLSACNLAFSYHGGPNDTASWRESFS